MRRSRAVQSRRCCLRIRSSSWTKLPELGFPGRRRDAVLPPPVRAGRALHRPGSGRRGRRALGSPPPPVSAEVPGCRRGEAGKETPSTFPFSSLEFLTASQPGPWPLGRTQEVLLKSFGAFLGHWEAKALGETFKVQNLL